MLLIFNKEIYTPVILISYWDSNYTACQNQQSNREQQSKSYGPKQV